jgi:hypothetical protein
VSQTPSLRRDFSFLRTRSLKKSAGLRSKVHHYSVGSHTDQKDSLAQSHPVYSPDDDLRPLPGKSNIDRKKIQRFKTKAKLLFGSVTGAGQVYSGRSSYAEYSSIQQAIYGRAVKPTGRFNDRT